MKQIVRLPFKTLFFAIIFTTLLFYNTFFAIQFSFAVSPVTITFDGHKTLTFNPDSSGKYCGNQFFIFITTTSDPGHSIWGQTVPLPYTLDISTINLTPGTSYTANIECADSDPGDKLTFTYTPLTSAQSQSQGQGPSCPRDGKNHNDFKGLGTDPDNNQSADSEPVIFVHGWTGGAMSDTASLLKQKLGTKINPFLFDYSKWSSYWPSDNNIAPCLADYVNIVSNDYRAKNPNGKVIIVAHSMGGLAIRYATDKDYAQNQIQTNVISNVITLDTPYLGSPWGGSNWAYIKQIWKRIFGNNLPNFVGSDLLDGGRCLIEHVGTQALPSGCGNLPTYLPKGVQLSEFAGNITIHRSLFGHTLYTIPLNSDGIVTVPSSNGYVTSGPSDQAPPGQVIVHSYTEDCSIDTGTVIQEALKLKTFSSLSADVINSLILFDYPTLHDLQNDNLNTLAVRTYSLAATMVGSCSHTNITSNPDVINQIANIINSDNIQHSSENEQACNSSLLFAADVAAEHLSTDPSQYPPTDPPGAYHPVCHNGWAVASISRPNVGTTDGLTLFNVKNGKWVYITGLGSGMDEYCSLIKAGMPSTLIPQFTSDTMSYYDPVSKMFYYGGSGVTPPSSAVPMCSVDQSNSGDINELLKQAYIQYERANGDNLTSEDQFSIVNLKTEGNYAAGDIQMMGGGAFIAKKVNGSWQMLLVTQAVPTCGFYNNYPDIPKDLGQWGTCMDPSTNQVVQR